ncbi:alpha/beta-hydrolase [Xylariaceae sp. FL0016]|nr:alpha/beta-hydrolase [Xylariaceae sp. FL0016]
MTVSRKLTAVLVAQVLYSLGATALPSPSSSASSTSTLSARGFPLLSDIPIPDALALSELYGAPDNDFDCASERNPVVVLHGLSANRDVDLNLLQKALNARGYCTFSQTWIGGLRDMAGSAADIAAFVRAVRDRTGADRVDLVGHSEGGVQALYVPMTQDGIADMVGRVVALGPAVHGADYYGFSDLWYVGGDVTRRLAKPFAALIACPACEDMMPGGAITDAFARAPKIAQDGNDVTVIMSRSDTLVSPDVSMIDEAGVNNVYVQDTCPDDKVGHAGLMWDKSVWRLIINALEENNDEVFPCEEGLEI